jgi:hypothetical protein
MSRWVQRSSDLNFLLRHNPFLTGMLNLGRVGVESSYPKL